MGNALTVCGIGKLLLLLASAYHANHSPDKRLLEQVWQHSLEKEIVSIRLTVETANSTGKVREKYGKSTAKVREKYGKSRGKVAHFWLNLSAFSQEKTSGKVAEKLSIFG